MTPERSGLHSFCESGPIRKALLDQALRAGRSSQREDEFLLPPLGHYHDSNPPISGGSDGPSGRPRGEGRAATAVPTASAIRRQDSDPPISGGSDGPSGRPRGKDEQPPQCLRRAPSDVKTVIPPFRGDRTAPRAVRGGKDEQPPQCLPSLARHSPPASAPSTLPQGEGHYHAKGPKQTATPSRHRRARQRSPHFGGIGRPLGPSEGGRTSGGRRR